MKTRTEFQTANLRSSALMGKFLPCPISVYQRGLAVQFLSLCLCVCALTPITFTGCKNVPAAAVRYHTLKDTQIAVDHAMQTYGLLCVQGKVSAAKQKNVAAAHASYRAAFREAVAVARLDYSKATPDNVAALANALLAILAQL